MSKQKTDEQAISEIIQHDMCSHIEVGSKLILISISDIGAAILRRDGSEWQVFKIAKVKQWDNVFGLLISNRGGLSVRWIRAINDPDFMISMVSC